MMRNDGEHYTITVDDDPMVSRIIERATGVKSLGFQASREIEQVCPQYHPLAVFLDIHLGLDESGLTLIPLFRSHWPYAPIIVVTSDPDDECLDEAFKQGANDFLLKPIKPREVQARFRTRLSELQERATRAALVAGDVRLDTAHRVVTGPQGRQFLAPVETLMLAQLIRSKGTVVPKEVIKREAWGPIHVSDNAFYRKLFELRRALEGVSDTVKIQSIYGTGLSLDLRGASLPDATKMPVSHDASRT